MLNDYELGFLSGTIFGILFTFFLVYLYIKNLVYKVLSEIDKQITNVQSKLVPVTIERINGQLFCYTETDKQFVCQGANMAEIKKAFESRFPDKTAFLSGGEESLLEELRIQLKELNEASDSK